MDDKRVVPKSKGEQVRVSRGGHRVGLPGLTESACWKQLTLSCITWGQSRICASVQKSMSMSVFVAVVLILEVNEMCQLLKF